MTNSNVQRVPPMLRLSCYFASLQSFPSAAAICLEPNPTNAFPLPRQRSLRLPQLNPLLGEHLTLGSPNLESSLTTELLSTNATFYSIHCFAVLEQT